MPEDLKKFTPAELAKYNGADGRPVYIAYRGRVYDVSDSDLWAGGEHMAGHFAGADLSRELPEAPHGEEVFERYPQVGVLEEGPEEADDSEAEAPQLAKSGVLDRIFKRFPLLKRHPHPMVVHFPIVFFISAPVFALLYLFTGIASFETTAFHCLAGGVLFTPVALLTGLLTWWLNYELRPLRPVVIKLFLTPSLLVTSTGILVWRWLEPEITRDLGHWPGLVYLGLLCALAPLVSIIGWYGASLTFPLREKS